MVQIVYVASPMSQQIHVWKLDDFHGVLQLIQVISTYGDAHPMAIHPHRRFLYVGVRPNFGITTYSINQYGFLKENGTIEVSSCPTYLISDVKGAFLYCASYRDNTISVIPINISGTIDRPIQIIEGLLGCHSVNIDRSGNFLWVPCLRENSIRLFKINTSGMLTPCNSCVIKTDIVSGPRHMVFHRFSHYAYVINEFTSTVNVIKYYDFPKKPNIVQTMSIIPKNINIKKFWAADIHITSDGRWLYCSDRVANIISCLSISEETKKLKFISYQFTEEQPRGFAIDHQGKFLIVAGQKSNYISLYHINSGNGKLTILSRHASGMGPMWINIVPFEF